MTSIADVASLQAGASGFSYKAWKGGFYPRDIKAEDMLSWYAERLPAVEINSSFYRMPRSEVLEKWARATPEAFRFAIKAPKRITHAARLMADEAAEPVEFLYRNLAVLGHRRGPVLFQLSPYEKKDVPRLEELLHLLPSGHAAAFEFRHESWLSDDVYEVLHKAEAALCMSEREGSGAPELVETASWGYVRLRLESYSEADLEDWARSLAGTAWRRIYVFFMHEPTAPAYAVQIMKSWHTS
jgi:uncharacterized protein YecE (DUF72 family)